MKDYMFRGKRIDNGELVYGSLINNMFFKSETGQPCTYIVNPDEFEDYSSFEDMEHLAVEVDPETVGQYTGLKDKYGKEVYEGDIFIAPHDFGPGGFADRKAVVKFHETRGYQWEYWLLEKLEVIGNIYDNPELLQGGTS